MDRYLKNKKIKRSKTEIEFHQVFLDKLTKTSAQKIESPFLGKVFNKFLFFIFFLFFILFCQTFYFQIIEGGRLSTLAKNNAFIIHQIQAHRGVIYDQFFNQLVFNQPSFNLILSIRDLPQGQDEKIKLLNEVSQIINVEVKTIKEKIDQAELNQVLILENLSHQTLIILEARMNDLPGFEIQKNMIRFYQDGEIFSHLIGYTGKITPQELRERPGQTIFDWVGREGIERYYENILRKNPGKRQIERDVFGNIISEEIISLPEPGKSLVLWLDSDLQRKIFQELQSSIKRVNAQAGVAIALDPRSGGILSLVSYPSFDNNIFQQSNSEEINKLLNNQLRPLFNRAVSGQYAPGSTIKPFIAAAALEENLITAETKIFSDGKIEIPHQYNPNIIFTFRDFRRHGHGWTDVKKAIADSVNTFFYAIGGGYKEQRGLGPDLMKKYLELFGWGKETGINLPGENRGLLPSPSWKQERMNMNWRLGDSYLFSIGQGNVLATPLQLAVATAAIANRGKLLEPQIVKEIIDSPNEITKKIIREDFISPETLEIVRQGMRQTVLSGTGVMLNQLPVKAAAKTGMAETPKEGYYHRWLTAFAPYENPEIVLVIIIESVRGDLAIALPPTKEILNWYFTRER